MGMKNNKAILPLAVVGLSLSIFSGRAFATQISQQSPNSETLARVEAMLDGQSEQADSAEAAASRGGEDFENLERRKRGNGHRGSSGHRGHKKPDTLSPSTPVASNPAESASKVAPVEKAALTQKKADDEEKTTLFTKVMDPAYRLLENENPFVTLLGAFVGMVTLPVGIVLALGESIYDLKLFW